MYVAACQKYLFEEIHSPCLLSWKMAIRDACTHNHTYYYVRATHEFCVYSSTSCCQGTSTLVFSTLYGFRAVFRDVCVCFWRSLYKMWSEWCEFLKPLELSILYVHT